MRKKCAPQLESVWSRGRKFPKVCARVTPPKCQIYDAKTFMSRARATSMQQSSSRFYGVIPSGDIDSQVDAAERQHRFGPKVRRKI